MKLAPVLAQYLANQKKLSLPGVGIFHADSTYNPDVDYGKKGTPLLNISFEAAKITQFDEDLVTYVSEQTGKMKVLAESDLRSQLEGATDFLNTGKPYFLAGIGTLTKKADGSMEFHKEKFQHTTEKEKKQPAPATEKIAVPQAYIDENQKPRKGKPAAIIGVICAIAVAAIVWFYLKNNDKNNADIEDVTSVGNDTETNAAADTSNTTASPQASTQTAAASTSDSYKYILEITQQPRASKRYNQLKTINWPVEMATSDSVNFKLFITMPIANADTTRIKDSLSALSGKKVWIER